jgi:hypothetical protein
MTGTKTRGNLSGDLTTMLVLVTCFAWSAETAEKAYTTHNADEVEIISLVLASEVRANNWTKDDLVCVSIDDKDPDKKLVKTLRGHGLNVCKASDWHRNLACGLRIDMRWISIEPSQTARLHAATADFREINSGVAHLLYRAANRIHGYSTRTAPFRASAEVLANYKTENRCLPGKRHQTRHLEFEFFGC